MTQKQKDLHQALLNFDIDGGPVDLTFSQRLARENGWTRAFAERVVREYKRFVFLASTGTEPVTPSHQVDQAWHLHMTYTDSYWTRMCGQILPRPLHHNPTKGGQAENEKFDHWYNRTLATYATVFGEESPSDIWPESSIRFGQDTRNVTVNGYHNYVLPKKTVRRSAQVVAAAVTATVLVGCTVREGRQLPLTILLVMVGVAAIGGLIYWAYKSGWLQGNGGHGCGGGGGCGTGYAGDGSDSSGHSGCSSSGCSSGCGGGGCGGGGCSS